MDRKKIFMFIFAIFGTGIAFFFYSDYKNDSLIQDFEERLNQRLTTCNSIDDSLMAYNIFQEQSMTPQYKDVLPSFVTQKLSDNLGKLKKNTEQKEQKRKLKQSWDNVKYSNSKKELNDFIAACNGCEYADNAQQRIRTLENKERELEERKRKVEADERRQNQQRVVETKRKNKTYSVVLDRLKCYKKEDITEKDKVYINVGGATIASGQRMGDGDVWDLSHVSPIEFKGSTNIEVYDDDKGDWIGGDDLLISIKVKSSDTRGKHSTDKSRNGRHWMGHYKLFYSIVEN